MTDADPDTLVNCVCEHRKDDHCNGIEYCKRIGCRCLAFQFRSPTDRAIFDCANDPYDPFRMAQISQETQTDMDKR